MAGDRRALPLALIDEPDHAMRQSMTDSGLDDLVSSIRQLGVLQPILVRPLEGGRFAVVAGHRRLLASRAAGLETIPSVIYRDERTAVAARVHENVVREDVSPAEEAVYYQELYAAAGDDVDAVAALVKRPRDYVERRLLLAQGDPAVLGALRDGAIVAGVAEELNRMKRPEDRDYYLHHAVHSGASIRQMRQWRADANLRAELAAAELERGAAAEAGTSPPAPPPAPPSYAARALPHELSSSKDIRACLFCEQELEEWRMYRKFVCEPCASRFLTGDGMKGGSRA